jgi:WD40 repeat protein
MKVNYNLFSIVLSNLNYSNLNSLKSNNTTLLSKIVSVRIKRQIKYNLYPFSNYKEIDKDKYKTTDLIELENGKIAASYTDGYIKVFNWKSPFKLVHNFRAHNGKIVPFARLERL